MKFWLHVRGSDEAVNDVVCGGEVNGDRRIKKMRQMEQKRRSVGIVSLR